MNDNDKVEISINGGDPQSVAITRTPGIATQILITWHGDKGFGTIVSAQPIDRVLSPDMQVALGLRVGDDPATG